MPQSPANPKRKSRTGNDITNTIKPYYMLKEEIIEVMMLAINQLGILDQVRLMCKPSYAWRKLTILITRQKVLKILAWALIGVNKHRANFSKFYISDKPLIQANLKSASTVMTKRQRNQLFYQSINKVVEKTFSELYIQYIRKQPESNHFSFGTFLALEVFYKPLHWAHEQLSV